MSVSFPGAKKLKKHNGFSNSAVIKVPLPSPIHFFGLHQGDITLNPLVKKGEYVLVGHKIADMNDSNAVPVYSSVSGVVADVTEDMISIENNFLFERTDAVNFEKTPDEMTSRELLWILRESGVCEARTGTPVHTLLSSDKADCIIVCCFDSDPYISSPQMAAKGNAKKILKGLEIVQQILGIKKTIIGIENDTKINFSDFKYNLRYNDDILLYSLKARYPQSRDDILVKTLTGKDMSRINAVILSSETLLNIANVFETGFPVINKIVTVSGDDILPPLNYIVPLGMPVSSLLSNSGYTSPKKVIIGGVIDGKQITDLDIPINNHTNAVLAFSNEENIPQYEIKKLI